jgi:hypothetical protein
MHLSETVMLTDIGGLLLLPLTSLAFAFGLWMIVDCAKYETGSTMIAWLMAILFAGIVAAPLYFLIRKCPRRLQGLQLDLAPKLYQPWRKDQEIG